MHALAHPIGARFDTHHGMTNAVLMPYVLVANRSAIEETIDRLAAYAGIADGFDGFVARVLSMRDELGVPHRLTELGVDASAVDEIAPAAVADPSAGGNPIPFTEALAADVFVNACAGTLEGLEGVA
jgi:alcohol dehydrogenase class IV